MWITYQDQQLLSGNILGYLTLIPKILALCLTQILKWYVGKYYYCYVISVNMCECSYKKLSTLTSKVES